MNQRKNNDDNCIHGNRPQDGEVCHDCDLDNMAAQYESEISKLQSSLAKAVTDFYDRVCKRAEENMLKTGKLEGAHFAAMKKEMELLKDLKEKAS